MSGEMLKIQNEEYRKLLLEKDDEINNYKFAIRIKDNQTHELIDKLQQKENIIKEVREYLDSIKEKQKVVGVYTKDIHKHILEILDKVEE